MSIDNVFRPLQQRINHFLADYMSNIPASVLQEAMAYSLLAGGKRIRPFLVYSTGQMFGCQLEELDIPAAAIESIHTYSLIHDDLPAMDNDSLRRGLPTCHVKFGEANAILAGDGLQTLAFAMLASTNLLSNDCKIAMISELSHASGVFGMCLGQVFDLQAEHQQIALEQLQQIHRHKTGVLIKSAIRLGIFAAGDIAKPYQIHLDNYADIIGLAFQIRDDILDEIGKQEVMGKPQGSDQQLGKSTYPSLLGLDNAIQMTEQLYQQAIDELNEIPYNSQSLRRLAEFIIKRDS